MKCKFCGIDNAQVIIDFNEEQVCSDIPECSLRMVDNAKVFARKFLANDMDKPIDKYHSMC